MCPTREFCIILFSLYSFYTSTCIANIAYFTFERHGCVKDAIKMLKVRRCCQQRSVMLRAWVGCRESAQRRKTECKKIRNTLAGRQPRLWTHGSHQDEVLNSAFNGASRYRPFIPGGSTLGIHLIGNFVGSIADLDTEEKTKIIVPDENRNPGRPVRSLISHYMFLINCSVSRHGGARGSALV
jgi:hypothetical protein